MPLKPLRPCNKHGCNTLTRARYCEAHMHIVAEHKAKAAKQYDKTRRDKQSKAFYDSALWKKVRAAVLFRDLGLCQECKRNGIEPVPFADVVHHIIELRVDWSKRLDSNNLESLCHKCHNRMHPKGGGGN